MKFEKRKLGSVATYINGRAFKPSEWEKEGLPIIRIQNLTDTNAACNYSTKDFEEKFKVRHGDLLFAWSASLGAHIWKKNDAWLNQHIFRVVPNEDIDKMYLYYFLCYVVNDLYAKTHGSGMVHITKGPFMNTEILVPSLIDQQCIVSRIEELFSEFDQGVDTLQTLKQQLAVYRQAVLKESINGKPPKQIVKMADIANVGTGATPLTSNKAYYGGKIAWIKSGKINEEQIFTPSEYITELALAETNCKVYPPHTLLVAMYGEGKTRGKCAELMIPAAINQALAAVELHEDNNGTFKDYLKWYLTFNYENIRRKAAGGVQPNLNLNVIKNIRIPLFEESEYETIVRDIESRLSVCNSISETVDSALTQADAMRQSILKKAFEGGLT